MRVLLTGATGFLGSHLLARLGGHQVLCPSRTPSRLPRGTGIKGLVADLSQQGDWTAEIVAFRPEWCFHLAWEGLPDYSLLRCRVNLDASLRLLEAAALAGVRKMIVTGSCWEYGRVSGAVSEDHTPEGLSVFGATKHALRSMLDSVAREASFTYRWARVFFVYGPGQRPQSLLPQIHSAHANGRRPTIRNPSTVQDFVHVDDVAEALVALATCEAPSGVFNVGTGKPTSVGYVANRAADYFGAVRPFDLIPDGDGFWADMTKTAALTGWYARIQVDEGVHQTLAALKGAA